MSLFDKLKQYRQITSHSEKQAIARNVLHFPTKYINSAGRILFENLRDGGKAIFVVPGRGGWNPETEYFKAARDAAKRGFSITRVFLLPHSLYMREPVLQRHWELDKASGIKVEFAISGEDLQRDVEFPLSPSTLDFGIWDGELVCYIIYNQEFSDQTQLDEWIVSRRAEDIESANRNWRILDNLPRLTISPADALKEYFYESQILQTAPFAAMLADFLCREECRWFHRIWQYLSVMGLVPTPAWHAKFYLDELTASAFNKPEPTKVLVSGAADYLMLAYILRAFEGKSLANITVLDVCQTPLHLCQWYSMQQGVQIETLPQDILKVDKLENFDLIATDDFLTMFDDGERLQIVKAWYDGLIPGGKIVTTARIEEGGTPNRKITAAGSQVRDFANRAAQLAKQWHEFTLREPNWVEHEARIFAEKISSWPFPSPQEVTSLLTSTGFKVGKFDLVASKGEMKPTTYARIVAYK